MPLYDFQDTETGEVFELQLKLSEREEFLKANPNVKQLLSAPRIVSGVDGCLLYTSPSPRDRG